jgi:repressor LexA
MPAVLSDLERRILDYMVQYLRSHTYQPSIREIGEEFGIRSTKTVSEHLGALAEKGYLERDPSRSRGVRILGVDLDPNTVSIPLFGELPRAARGFESDGVEGWLSVDRRLGAQRGAYYLRVRDTRWRGVDLRPGDHVLVEPAQVSDLAHGDLAVLFLNGEPELYRVDRSVEGGREGRTLRVRSARSGESLMVEDPERLTVGGRVAGLHRRFDDAPLPTSPTAH